MAGTSPRSARRWSASASRKTAFTPTTGLGARAMPGPRFWPGWLRGTVPTQDDPSPAHDRLRRCGGNEDGAGVGQPAHADQIARREGVRDRPAPIARRAVLHGPTRDHGVGRVAPHAPTQGASRTSRAKGGRRAHQPAVGRRSHCRSCSIPSGSSPCSPATTSPAADSPRLRGHGFGPPSFASPGGAAGEGMTRGGRVRRDRDRLRGLAPAWGFRLLLPGRP